MTADKIGLSLADPRLAAALVDRWLKREHPLSPPFRPPTLPLPVPSLSLSSIATVRLCLTCSLLLSRLHSMSP